MASRIEFTNVPSAIYIIEYENIELRRRYNEPYLSIDATTVKKNHDKTLADLRSDPEFIIHKVLMYTPKNI